MARIYLGFLTLLLLAFGAAAHAAAPYYEGKTLRLIVAFAPGGGFDTYSRALGRHLGHHIPGNPTIVVDNMTGAGGIVHANYMFRQGKPDGLTIGNNIRGGFFQQLMGAKGIEFDGRKFEYIGAPAVDHPVCVLTKASGVNTMDKWLAAKEPLRLGGVGPGGAGSRLRSRAAGPADPRRRAVQRHFGDQARRRGGRTRRRLLGVGIDEDNVAAGHRFWRGERCGARHAEKARRTA